VARPWPSSPCKAFPFFVAYYLILSPAPLKRGGVIWLNTLIKKMATGIDVILGHFLYANF